MNQANLGGVAHGRTARFRVVYDVQGFLQVGRGIHINMADTRACFDAGHLGAVHAGADEALAAPGDQQVHKAAGLHQVGGTGAGGILHQIHQRAGRSAVLQPRAQRGDNGCIGADGLLAAAQHADALFYPILVGKEKTSWERLVSEALPRFLAGTFAGAYQEQLLAEQREILK